ncbi:hypothetical protein [Ornithinimicrobium kibberense]|uniref:hypothetical protein n=1 Tax=Ornithinimicrobium kibberense TaxID=282060 RepID=UPI003605ABD0
MLDHRGRQVVHDVPAPVLQHVGRRGPAGTRHAGDDDHVVPVPGAPVRVRPRTVPGRLAPRRGRGVGGGVRARVGPGALVRIHCALVRRVVCLRQVSRAPRLCSG